MKNVKWLLVAAFAALAAGFAVAQSSIVQFADGAVQIKSGTAWKALDIGQALAADAVVRLGPGALLELSAEGGRSLMLSKAGIYELAPLWKSAPAAKSSATKVLGVVERMVAGTSAAPPSAVAGVRGASSDSEDLLWLEDAEDPEALYASGRKAESEGRFAEAAVLYAEALRVTKDRSSLDKERAAVSAYSAARAFVAAGQMGRALSALKSADPDYSKEIRPFYALLEAALLAEFGDAEGARALVERGKAGGWFSGDSLKEAEALLATLKK